MKRSLIPIRKLALTSILLAAAALLPAMGVWAYPALEEKAASLTVTGSKPVEGVSYSLYRVADLSQGQDGDVLFPLTDSMKAYAESVDLDLFFEDMTQASWAAGAATLAPYLLRDRVSPGRAETSDQTGTVSFPSLECGLYLMTASYSGTAYTSVTMAPCFLTLPELSEDETSWIYDVHATAKLETQNKGVKGEVREKTVTVKKAWSGDGDAQDRKERPKSVTVQLLTQDGSPVEERELSSENGWTYTWKNLDAIQTYEVVEKDVPQGYRVSSSHTEPKTDLISYVLTNKKRQKGFKGKHRETPQGPAGGRVAGESRLPQTGQLWWPVFLLAGCGIVLILLGMWRRGSGRDKSKTGQDS